MPDEPADTRSQARSKDEIALELMKFISIQTGYGKGAPSAGFSGKTPRNPEEYAEALLELYQRCRAVILKSPETK